MYGDPTGDLVAAVVGVGLTYILLIFAGTFLNYYIFYRIVKAAVKNGTVEAINKTGGGFGGGNSNFVQGFPPEQDYAPPAAPAYRGPNG